jgi:ATP-dependent protease ClpP protease subunit
MKDNLNKLLQIKNMTDTSADLYLYGDIISEMDYWDENNSNYPKAIKTFLDDASGKDLNIYINSGGGSVFAGMAIYNMIKRHNGKKTVRVDGVAASIASVIALAGDEIVIPSNAYFMIHKPWTVAMGDSNAMRKMADTLDVIEQGIMNVYRDNLNDGVPLKIVQKMVDAETWLTGDEASQYFRVTVSPAIEAVAYAGALRSEKAPANIKQVNQVEAEMKLHLLKIKGDVK